VTPPKVPLEVPPESVKRMVEPPAVRELPAASFAVTVAVAVVPEATVPEEIETRD
jgi:hypothetical protein